jgi:hypothetical protein
MSRQGIKSTLKLCSSVKTKEVNVCILNSVHAYTTYRRASRTAEISGALQWRFIEHSQRFDQRAGNAAQGMRRAEPRPAAAPQGARSRTSELGRRHPQHHLLVAGERAQTGIQSRSVLQYNKKNDIKVALHWARQ